MKKIPLTQGKFALVDDEDWEHLSKFHWMARRNRYSNKLKFKWYAYRLTPRNNYARKTIYLHHEIMKTKLIDHINGDGLDNRKNNLRKCSRSENQRNRSVSNNSKIGLKGVRFDSRKGRVKRFYATITHEKKIYFLGFFMTKEEAHEAYKQAAIKYHGEFAKW